MQSSRRNYVIISVLVAIFLAPGVLAYLFYEHPAWLSGRLTNQGRLITPPVLLTTKPATEKWSLVLWSPAACTKECTQLLDQLARIRLALGRRLYEVETRLLVQSDVSTLSPQLATMLHENDIHMAILSGVEDASILPDTLGIFIANPKGYLILAYAPTVQSASSIYHDIKKLLNTHSGA